MSRFHRRLSTYVVILAFSQSVAAALPIGRATTQPATSSAPSPSSQESTSRPSSGTETKDHIEPRVEVFVPSVKALVDAAKKSRSAALFDAFSGMIPKPDEADEEGLDLGSVIRLMEKIGSWPDTSVAVAIFTEDRDGRPRWTLRMDWSLDVLVENLNGLLQDEAASELLEDLALRRDESSTEDDPAPFRLELGDDVLAVLSESGSGCLIASTGKINPPDTMFGQPTEAESDASDGAKSKKKRSLIYCRLNLAAKDDAQSDSLFSSLSGISDILYGASLKKNGQWSEKFSVNWNWIVGAAMKVMFRKTDRPFDCPRDAYALAVMDLALAEGLSDGLAGLPPGTIGGRSGTEMAVAVTPGSGFLPFPDVFFQFRARKKAKIIKDIRRVVAEANKKRHDDDRPLEWQEETIEGRVVFCKTPLGGGGSAFLPVRYRTVIFFDDPPDAGGSKKHRLIIAQTSTWADDAVRRWDSLRRKTFKMPSSSKVHWQGRIRWKKIYELAGPYMTLLTSFAGADAAIPPDAEELSASLADAVINVKITSGGLSVRHTGPVPIGAVYVPAVAAISLGSSSSPSSESARERVAARHLRVLYHHAKLFRKDYGRWPATVAELDGYVDFASHAQLLKLRPKTKSFVEGLTTILSTSTGKAGDDDADDDENDIDDSLYAIVWSSDESDWRLGIREGELTAYKTMYIDAKGEIHRVEKEEDSASPLGGAGDGGAAQEESSSP